MSKLAISQDDLLALSSADRILTIATLREHGISRSVQSRLLRGGSLHQLAAGVFSVGAPSWHGYVAAALSIAGRDALAYAGTASALHGLLDQELPVHILTPLASQPRSKSWVTFHRSDLIGRMALDHLTIPRVGFDDSVLDALGHLDEVETIAMLTRALQERRTTPHRLLARLDARSRVAHRTLVRGILLDGAGIESALEHAYVTRVERPHGLPPMQRQFIVPETGHRADGAYPQRRSLIHLDGARYHDPDADRILDVRHAAFGYSSSRITWRDCWLQPCATARNIAGGTPPRRCRKCSDRT